VLVVLGSGIRERGSNCKKKKEDRAELRSSSTRSR
jgi:hypothetical protein